MLHCIAARLADLPASRPVPPSGLRRPSWGRPPSLNPLPPISCCCCSPWLSSSGKSACGRAAALFQRLLPCGGLALAPGAGCRRHHPPLGSGQPEQRCRRAGSRAGSWPPSLTRHCDLGSWMHEFLLGLCLVGRHRAAAAGLGCCWGKTPTPPACTRRKPPCQPSVTHMVSIQTPWHGRTALRGAGSRGAHLSKQMLKTIAGAGTAQGQVPIHQATIATLPW